LPVSKHWIGDVYLNIVDGKPVMYADIDKLGDTNNGKRGDTNNGKRGDTNNGKRGDTKDNKEFGVTDLLNTQFFRSSKIGGEFLRKKRKILENKNKIKKKTVVI
jgi:hypothetical protein